MAPAGAEAGFFCGTACRCPGGAGFGFCAGLENNQLNMDTFNLSCKQKKHQVKNFADCLPKRRSIDRRDQVGLLADTKT